jgi:predicted RNA-binding Zn ribbon-like protein
MSELPSWYPGASENKPAPMPLLRVQGFVNTLDLEDGTDLLADLETARAWLTDAGLLAAGAELGEDDLTLAREVREGIRSLLEGGGELAPLRRVTAEHRARLTVAQDGRVGLQNAGAGQLGDGLFELLLTVHRAQEDGTWSRLKVCANPDCRWAFFDRSRNQQGSWCSMAVWGNRLKNRELRARRR